MDARPDGGQAKSPIQVGHPRRWALGVVAAVILFVGGIGAWVLLGGSGSDNGVHDSGPGGVSTGQVLEWAEFDPDLGDADIPGLFEPLEDGRILMSAHRLEGDEAELGLRLLVTENGFEWSEVPIPTGLWPPQFDLSGKRWLVAGNDIRRESDSSVRDPNGGDSPGLVEFRAFYSDDQGASWTESGFDYSSSSMQEPTTYDFPSYFPTAVLASGDHMVIVLQGDESDTSAGSDSDSAVAGRSGEESEMRPKARIFASDGGNFEQVAEYDGSIYNSIIFENVSTPAGFSLTLHVEGATEQAPFRPYTLTSPDGRTWSKSEGPLSFFPAALGPDGSQWKTAWTGTGYGLHQFDREGTLTTEVAFDNAIPFQVAAGRSGLAVNAAAFPGSNIFALPDKQIAKDGYELRLNEPEMGFTLWDLAAGAAVYECGPEVLWVRGFAPFEGDCRFKGPEDDDTEMDAEVLVFEDRESGVELVSFTRGELAPEFPLWIFTGLVFDSPDQEEQWLGWSADGAEWGWQTPADAFGIDPAEADEPRVLLAVGDGFVLARMQQFSDQGLPQDRWFIAQVP